MPLDTTSIKALVTHPDANPHAVQPYAKHLETTVAGLMDATFKSADPDETWRLAAMELRCRLILDRWRKGLGVN